MNKSEITNKRAEKSYADFLRALCETGTSAAAKHLNRDDSVISRLKSDEAKLTLFEFCSLAGFLGIEMNNISSDVVKVDRMEYESLIAVSEFALNKIKQQETDLAINAGMYNALCQLARERLTDMRVL